MTVFIFYFLPGCTNCLQWGSLSWTQNRRQQRKHPNTQTTSHQVTAHSDTHCSLLTFCTDTVSSSAFSNSLYYTKHIDPDKCLGSAPLRSQSNQRRASPESDPDTAFGSQVHLYQHTVGGRRLQKCLERRRRQRERDRNLKLPRVGRYHTQRGRVWMTVYVHHRVTQWCETMHV